MSLDPAALARRGCLYRELAAAGAPFAEVNGSAAALRLGADAETEAAVADQLLGSGVTPVAADHPVAISRGRIFAAPAAMA